MITKKGGTTNFTSFGLIAKGLFVVQHYDRQTARADIEQYLTT